MNRRFVSVGLLIGLSVLSVYDAWWEWGNWYRSGFRPFSTFGNFLLYLAYLIPLFLVSWGWVIVTRGRSGVLPIALSTLLWMYLCLTPGLFSTPVRFAVFGLCIAGLTFGLVVGLRGRENERF
jgi:hypothetical protein